MASQGLRERKNAEVKRALYSAAMDLFRRKGFDETSVDEIAELAGYSRATFFNHFGSKQGVLRCYGQEIQVLVDQVIEAADPHADPLELIREVIVTMAREAAEHLDEVKLIYTYSFRDPNYMFDPTPARKRVWEILSGLVTDAQRRELIRRDLPAHDLALHILCLYQGIVLGSVVGLGNAESLVHSAWQFMLTGVKGGDSAT